MLDGADAAGPAGEKSADRAAHRGGHHRDLLSVPTGRCLECDERGAGLRVDPAVADLDHPAATGQIDYQPPGERHGLTVVAGTPDREG